MVVVGSGACQLGLGPGRGPDHVRGPRSGSDNARQAWSPSRSPGAGHVESRLALPREVGASGDQPEIGSSEMEGPPFGGKTLGEQPAANHSIDWLGQGDQLVSAVLSHEFVGELLEARLEVIDVAGLVQLHAGQRTANACGQAPRLEVHDLVGDFAAQGA